MSRIGKHPVVVPAGVTVDVARGANGGQTVTAKGKLGQISIDLTDDVSITVADGLVDVKPHGQSKRAQLMWGTARMRVNNLVLGVTKGFSKVLDIEGVGFRCAVQGKDLVLQLGFSHEIRYPMPEGITIKAEKPTQVTISGIDRQKVGQVAAELRAMKKPEPYKGKGIRYSDEKILRKEGKKK